MILLKLILVPTVVIFLAQVWSEFRHSRLGIFWLLFWLGAWVSVIAILFYPSLTTRVAKFLGIGRGVDAIIYLSIILLFYLIFRIYLKIEKLNRKITQLVQKDALIKTD